MIVDKSGNNTMAVVSAVSAGIGWLLGGLGSCVLTFIAPPLNLCTWLVFLVGSVAAVITGYKGRNEIRESGGLQEGSGLATFGIYAGWAGVAFNILGICLFVLLIILGIMGLTVLGPEIGNVFSDIIRGLEVQ